MWETERFWNTYSRVGCLYQTPPRRRVYVEEGVERLLEPDVIYYDKETVSSYITDMMPQWTHRDFGNMYWVCRDGVLAPRVKSEYGLPHLIKKLCTGRGKVSSLPWILPGYINHSAGQALCPEIGGQHKTNGILGAFLSHLLWELFYLISLLFLYLVLVSVAIFCDPVCRGFTSWLCCLLKREKNKCG